MKKTYLFGLIFFLTTNLYASPLTSVKKDYYDISGTTAPELRKQMNNQGPTDHGARMSAYTSWAIKWRYDYDQTDSGCSLTNIRVYLDIVYQLPHWTNYDDGDSALQSKWESFSEHLLTHENGHADNGKGAAKEIENALQNYPEMSSCKALGDAANSAATDIINQHKEYDLSYDAETEHGHTQGARFP